MRAAVYVRYSTDKQSAASVRDQFRQCRRAARSGGLAIVAVFKDRGLSGGTAARPGYQALLAAARAGSFDIIVAEDISRLWRSNAEYGPRSAELSDLGIHLVTCVGDDTRREGWGLMLAIKQAIAEQARRETSYRTRRGLEGRALAGKSTGGRCYGYTAAGDIDPAESAVVLRMFATRKVGASQQKIADQLNAAGVPAPRGGLWRQSTVHGILANPRYAGRVIYGRRLWSTSAADSARKTRRMRPGGPLVERQDELQAILPPELRLAPQKIA